MVAQHYRWDFVGLSTDTKPTPATSEKVVDGSTFYCSDTSKLYVFCKDTWYERKALGSGGGGTTYTAGDGIDITNNTISVDTTTIQPKLTAGSNVSISDNTISATDTTYSNFTGTDGTAAGTAGLVPAPATTDAGKFLKADGSWDTAGGGGGGDTVYSDKSTSNSSTGGAVYIGNLNSSQDEQPDPTATDNHYKYFWALPASNASTPAESSINILGNNPATQGICLGIGTQSSPANYYSISVGLNANTSANNAHSAIAFGPSTTSSAENSIAFGRGSQVPNSTYKNSVALGSFSQVGRKGEVNVGTGGYNVGYNNTDYRVIGGVHDGQLANDAVTVGQVNALIDVINTALSTNISHIGATS